ncbi:MAG: diaminopimelate epimerase [Clostridia bacterium]|nr:diaminopimelate epimerase [Clostridia bacterium]
MRFTKMHGLGNDYIYFDCTKTELPEPEKTAEILSHRNFGVGGDGIVLIMRSDIADFKMRMFNMDGSEGKMCGNATRCIGKYVYEKGLTSKTDLALETLSGIKKLKLTIKDNKVSLVSVDMGKAELRCDQIPVIYHKEKLIGESVEIGASTEKITCVSMGNPHCVLFKPEINSLDLEKIGPIFENHAIFPDRTNTEFVQVVDARHIRMRVWERGSGETMACGTGACAAVVAAIENGFCPRDTEITVSLLGGELQVCYSTNGTVTMTGSASFVFDGELHKEILEW